jgi:hypothetical protein
MWRDQIATQGQKSCEMPKLRREKAIGQFVDCSVEGKFEAAPIAVGGIGGIRDDNRDRTFFGEGVSILVSLASL